MKQTGSITRKSGSGRPRTAQTTANVDAVEELVLSQEDAPQTHGTVRETLFMLLTQHQFVNSINVGGRLRCSWPAATRLSCYRSSLFQTLNLLKLLPLSSNPSFCYLITSELSTASLSWQRLQLVLCHINNFYGKALMDNYLCQISMIPFDFRIVMRHNRRVRFFETRCT